MDLHCIFKPLYYILSLFKLLKDMVVIVYRSCSSKVVDINFSMDLVFFNMNDFDMILRMDWLSINCAIIDYFHKTVEFYIPK